MRMYKNGKFLYYIMIAREEFRLLPGFEDKVKVNNLGTKAINLNYKNTGKERRFKLSKTSEGYYNFGFVYKGKYHNFGIHRAVAMAFIPNPDNLPEVNHKDENPSNNCVDNLEWCTRIYNANYGRRNKKRVGCYKNGELIKIYESLSDVKEDDFIIEAVSECCNNKRGRKTHPRDMYTWRFID